MTKREILAMSEEEIAFMYIVSSLSVFSVILDEVAIENEVTRKGYLATTFYFSTYSRNGKPHQDKVRVYGKHADAFLELLKAEYPSLKIYDNRQFKESTP